MAGEDGSILDPLWAKRLRQMWEWQRKFAVRGDITCQNTESNCTLTVKIPRPVSESRATPEDTGQYQGQVHQMLVDNVAGWDYTPVVNDLA